MPSESNDDDILNSILSFLNSRGYYFSAFCLEKESGVFSNFLPDCFLPLKDYIFNGKWTELWNFLQPLLHLYHDVCAKDITFLYYRQRICELCFEDKLKNDASALKEVIDCLIKFNTIEDIDDIMKQICSFYTKMISQHPSKHDFYLATRSETFKCFQLLLDAITEGSETDETRKENLKESESNTVPAIAANPQTSVLDSYSKFFNEQKSARSNYESLLKDIEVKQEKTRLAWDFLQDKTTNLSKTNEVSSSPPKNQDADQQFDQRITSKQDTSASLSQFASLSLHCDDKDKQEKKQALLPSKYIPVERTEDSAVIRSVAFHPHGGVVAIGSNSHTLKLCDIPEAAQQPIKFDNSKHTVNMMQVVSKRSQVHRGSIYSLAWNDQGNVLASCSNDKLIKIFSFDNHTSTLLGPQYDLSYHNGMVRDITFLKNYGSGSLLASGGANDLVIYTYACDVDTVVHQLTGHSDQVLSLYSWGNGMLASASVDRSVRLWDLRSSRCVSVLGFGTSTDYHSIPTSVCVDANGSYLAVGRNDNVVSVYDLKAGKIVGDYSAHSNEVRGIRFNPLFTQLLMSSSYDGSIVVADINALFSGSKVNLWDHSRRCSFHTDKVIQCRWHPNGLTFASTSADQSCVLWTSVQP